MISKPFALKGVKYREVPAGKLLSRNLLVYGLGGLIAPIIFLIFTVICGIVYTGIVTGSNKNCKSK